MEIKFLDNLSNIDRKDGLNNPFKIRLKIGAGKGKEPDLIEGWIAEDSLEIGTGNDWVELYSVVGAGALETINNIIVGISGWSLRTKSMLTKVWSGTKTVDIKVGIIFQAETNAKTDVWDKIWKLFRAASPGESGGIEQSGIPGLETLPQELKKFFETANTGLASVPLMQMVSDKLGKVLVGKGGLLSSHLLQKPGAVYNLAEVHIGNMLHLTTALIRNVNISTSLSNIGYDLSKNIRPDSASNTFPNYARVDLELMTNSIWSTEDVTGIMTNGIPGGKEPPPIFQD